jgi:hypothetical protein
MIARNVVKKCHPCKTAKIPEPISKSTTIGSNTLSRNLRPTTNPIIASVIAAYPIPKRFLAFGLGQSNQGKNKAKL